MTISQLLQACSCILFASVKVGSMTSDYVHGHHRFSTAVLLLLFSCSGVDFIFNCNQSGLLFQIVTNKSSSNLTACSYQNHTIHKFHYHNLITYLEWDTPFVQHFIPLALNIKVCLDKSIYIRDAF
jgi:hypothetical protein